VGSKILRRALSVCADGLAVALLLICCSASTRADAIQQFSQNYGSLNGSSVIYQDIYEDTTSTMPNSGAPMKMGQPTIVGDELLFMPNGVKAFSSGAASQYTDSQVNMSVIALPGQTIGSFSVDESGDFRLSPGAAETNALWQLGAPQLLVTEVDHTPSKLLHTVTVTPHVSFNTTPSSGVPHAPNGTQFFATSVPSNGDISVAADFDIVAALAAAGVTGKATKLELVFDNSLTAVSAANTWSYIAKKEVQIYAGGQPLPEPGTLGLLGAGLLGLVWLGRPKTKRLPARSAA
jgi:hypothetical protein